MSTRLVYMVKNILIGNGINIQYGGYEKYSNKAILLRLLENIRNGRYDDLITAMSSHELMEMVKCMHDVVVNIKQYKPQEDYLFLLMEKERISKQYDKNTKIEDVGLEDYFIALEMAYRKDDPEELINTAHREFQMLMLDAIYNNGEINHIEYGENFKKFISAYDHVFTLNYDANLDRYSDCVHHLHGDFRVLAPEFDYGSSYSIENPTKCKANLVTDKYAHVFSNTIMSWYWLEKYGEWNKKEAIYGADAFKQMEGHLDIIGMSPTNDEHIYIMINQSKISSVDYYYFSDEDADRIQSKIKKPITRKKVKKLWDRIENIR